MLNTTASKASGGKGKTGRGKSLVWVIGWALLLLVGRTLWRRLFSAPAAVGALRCPDCNVELEPTLHVRTSPDYRDPSLDLQRGLMGLTNARRTLQCPRCGRETPTRR